MTPLKISVGGSAAITRQPERGILNITVHAEGPICEVVSKEVTEISNELTKLFKDLSPKTEAGHPTADAPVVMYSSTSLRTWLATSFGNAPGGGFRTTTTEHTKEHRANLSLSAVFRDFAKMREVVGKLLTYPDVKIDSIDWKLTDATKKSLGSRLRKEAFRDAAQKANDYAEAVGCKVVAVEIVDSGQSSSGMVARPFGQASGGALFGAANSEPAPSPPSLDLTPQEIQATCSVNVRFQSVPDN